MGLKVTGSRLPGQVSEIPCQKQKKTKGGYISVVESLPSIGEALDSVANISYGYSQTELCCEGIKDCMQSAHFLSTSFHYSQLLISKRV